MTTRYRHRARGTLYTMLDRGVALQTTRPLDEGDAVAVYRGDDGRYGVRRQADFDDGRFEPIADAGADAGPGHRIADLLRRNAELEAALAAWRRRAEDAEARINAAGRNEG